MNKKDFEAKNVSNWTYYIQKQHWVPSSLSDTEALLIYETRTLGYAQLKRCNSLECTTGKNLRRHSINDSTIIENWILESSPYLGKYKQQ